MEQKKFQEILKNHIKKCGFTQKALAEHLGITQPQVNNIISGRERVGLKNAQRFSTILDIDPLWLMTQGESGTPPNAGAITLTALSTPASDTIEIPILNLDSRGGFLPNEETDVMEYAQGTMPFNRSIARAGDLVVSVYGDSMSPRYPAGSFILIRPIEQWREYIELGKTYVLELADWRRIIKIVRKGSDNAHYLLDSYNIDYESTEIATSFINNVWLVVASVNRETM